MRYNIEPKKEKKPLSPWKQKIRKFYNNWYIVLPLSVISYSLAIGLSFMLYDGCNNKATFVVPQEGKDNIKTEIGCGSLNYGIIYSDDLVVKEAFADWPSHNISYESWYDQISKKSTELESKLEDTNLTEVQKQLIKNQIDFCDHSHLIRCLLIVSAICVPVLWILSIAITIAFIEAAYNWYKGKNKDKNEGNDKK